MIMIVCCFKIPAEVGNQQPTMIQAGSIQYLHVSNNKINPGPPGDNALSEKILMESASEKDRISEVRKFYSCEIHVLFFS